MKIQATTFGQEIVGVWESRCFPVYDLQQQTIVNFNSTMLTISPQLNVASYVKVYDASDRDCAGDYQSIQLNSRFMIQEADYTIDNFPIQFVDIETQNINLDIARWSQSPTIFSIGFIDNDILYLGQSTIEYSGRDSNSRHNRLNMNAPFYRAIH
jgi:hypothetical protein